MPLVAVTLIVFVAMGIGIGWIASLLIVIGCIATTGFVAACLYFRQSGRFSSMKTVFSLGTTTVHRKCTKCTGGVQILYHRDGNKQPSWGTIPPEWNMIQKDGEGWGHFAPPVSSKRTCTCCHGAGNHVIVAGDDIKMPPPLSRRNRK